MKNDIDTQMQDELNSTMLFKINESEKLNLDGCSNNANVFAVVPLTPTNFRRLQAIIVKSIEVSQLDLSSLHGSHKSVSFAYSATFQSTDTINTDRQALSFTYPHPGTKI